MFHNHTPCAPKSYKTFQFFVYKNYLWFAAGKRIISQEKFSDIWKQKMVRSLLLMTIQVY